MSIKRLAIALVQYALLGLALLVTAGVSSLTTMRVVLKSQEVSVPALVGRTMPEAGDVTAQQRLQLRVEGKRNDPRIQEGRIVSQEPAPGSTLKRQRSIRVWVSLGPQRLRVPAVVGESVRGARLTLEDARVPVGRVVEVNDASAEGTILMQHPPPGETETLSAEGASLLVSLGPGNRDFVMPDLIGRAAGDVLDVLRQAGLKVGEIRYRAYAGMPAGVVLRQVPAAGYRVSTQSPVTLDISRSDP